jgi:chemotaxis protein MotA
MLVVVGAVLGGFAAEGGPIPILIQPVELLIIFGASCGAIVVMCLPHQLKKIGRKAFKALAGSQYSPAYAKELLTCLFQLALLVKKEGVIALEGHIAEPLTSPIFSNYPRLLKDGLVLQFVTDALRLQVDGAVTPEELEVMLDRELVCHEKEEVAFVHVLTLVADALPGLGIVAAVLGVIITMMHIDGSPEEIGHHVAVALVGTFLGILASYGFLQPTVVAMRQETTDSDNFLSAAKNGIISFAEGKAPVVVVETARRTLFSYNRPPREEVEEACKALRAA